MYTISSQPNRDIMTYNKDNLNCGDVIYRKGLQNSGKWIKVMYQLRVATQQLSFVNAGLSLLFIYAKEMRLAHIIYQKGINIKINTI